MWWCVRDIVAMGLSRLLRADEVPTMRLATVVAQKIAMSCDFRPDFRANPEPSNLTNGS
jgi:hypothetical protein